MLEILQAVSPVVFLVLAASVVYLAGAFFSDRPKLWYQLSVAAVLLAMLIWSVCGVWAKLPDASVVSLAHPAPYGVVLTLLAGLALVLIVLPTHETGYSAEFAASLLLVIASGALVAMARELVLLFLALELISVPTYLLLFLGRRDDEGREATTKYFFLSVLAAALFLYGLSLVYGAAGTTNLTVLAERAGQVRVMPEALLTAGLLLVLAGLGFKLAAVPFHFYAPDVYQGTTTGLAAVLAWAPKAAGVFAIVQVVCYGLAAVGGRAAWVIWLMAAATMTLGNLMALLQENLRRLLAYSGIAHAGYLLVGLGAGCVGGGPYLTANGTESALFYLLAYAAMTLGTFAALVYLHSPSRPVEVIDDLAGLAFERPGIAGAIAIMMFSLTGIPITAGFWGKLALFASAVTCNDPRYLWLAVIGVVNAAISAYYYLRIVGTMYMRESYQPTRPGGGLGPLSVAVAGVLLTIVVGLVPRPFIAMATKPQPAIAPRVAVERNHAAETHLAPERTESNGDLVIRSQQGG